MDDEDEVDECLPKNCPDCGSKVIETNVVDDPFQYGYGEKAVMLSAPVPFRRCITCGFEWTDSNAEDVRQAAINDHLRKLQARV